MANPDDIAALATAFRNAHYRVPELGTQAVIHVGVVAQYLEQALPARSYAFITAWNPDSEMSSRMENDCADGALDTGLDARQVRRRRAFASDAQGGHREDGWLVLDLALDDLDRLGRQFGQDGTLAWAAGEPVRLRLYHAAPDSAAAAEPWIDWLG